MTGRLGGNISTRFVFSFFRFLGYLIQSFKLKVGVLECHYRHLLYECISLRNVDCRSIDLYNLRVSFFLQSYFKLLIVNFTIFDH